MRSAVIYNALFYFFQEDVFVYTSVGGSFFLAIVEEGLNPSS
jgi:hypothetical protein